MSTYHRFLKVNFEANLNLEYIEHQFSLSPDYRSDTFIEIPKEAVDQKIIDFICNFEIDVVMFQVLKCKPKNKIHIHSDFPELNNFVKINWTWGAPNSELRWWEIKPLGIIHKCESPEPLKKHIGGDYLCAGEHDCTPLDAKKIIKPSLINAGVLHSVFNPDDENRYTLSLLIKNKKGDFITWSDAVKIFENVIE